MPPVAPTIKTYRASLIAEAQAGPALMTSREVAEVLGVTRPTVVNMAAEGRFPAPVVDGYRAKKWNRRHVERFIETGRVR